MRSLKHAFTATDVTSSSPGQAWVDDALYEVQDTKDVTDDHLPFKGSTNPNFKDKMYEPFPPPVAVSGRDTPTGTGRGGRIFAGTYGFYH